MKFFRQIILLFIICVPLVPAQKKFLPRFKDYKVSLYQGKIHLPNWMHYGSDGESRDELDKLVESPGINFAGKYFVAGHSCGTGCRYYTMTDLSSGRELDVLDDFTTAEPRPKTSDGYEYLTVLYNRYNSKMLAAQYFVDLKDDKEQCRERAFLFEGGKLKPITTTKYKCSKF